MAKIKRLSEHTISQIAAGEVIESPASVIKELIENSLDAQANTIEVFIKGNGFESIQIRDNGLGLIKDDLPLAIQSFTTSKLSQIDDLHTIESYGFRGEALGAISSVSSVLIESKEVNSEHAYKVEKEKNQIDEVKPSSLPQGTRIIVSDLFYDQPVRKKFHNNQNKVKKSIVNVVNQFAISYPHVSYSLHYEKETLIDVSATDSLSQRISQLFSPDFTDSLIPIYFKEEVGKSKEEVGENKEEAAGHKNKIDENKKRNYILEGYMSDFQSYKTNSEHIYFFINHRYVRYNQLLPILKKAYGELMPPQRYPVAFLFAHISHSEVDVNVHPQKMEVRFQEDSRIESFFFQALKKAIETHNVLKYQYLAKKKNTSLLKKFQKTRMGENDNEKNVSEYPRFDFSSPPEIRDSQPESEAVDKLKENVSDLTYNEAKNKIEITRNRLLANFKLHEKVYETFILATSEDGVYLFDQHTVHERVNYEKFLSKLSKKEGIRQDLVTPIPLGISPAEKELIKDHMTILKEIGFEIDVLGPSEYGLRSVPFYVDHGQEEEALHISLQKIIKSSVEQNDFKPTFLFEELAASLACRSAIKKGDPESLANLKELIDQLKKCENPMRCPHGRPTMVFLGKDDIFTLFKRNVRKNLT